MTHALTVSRSDLNLALTILAKIVNGRRASNAVLSWSDGMLVIDLPGGSTKLPAAGTWPGTVRVGGEFILVLAKVPPMDDPVTVSVRDGRLRIEDSSSPCVLDEVKRSIIDVPLNAPLHAVLNVGRVHSADEIARSGLTPLVDKSAERRDALIARAAKVLQPLMVEVEDVLRLADECIRRKHHG